jgi:DNA polymerase/3'-5' exonuclease PolX
MPSAAACAVETPTRLEPSPCGGIIERASRTLAPFIEQRRLQEIPGIGKAIADLITGLHRTGTDARLEEISNEIPTGVLEHARPARVLLQLDSCWYYLDTA